MRDIERKRASDRAYAHSEKGRARFRRYNASAKRRAASRRYQVTGRQALCDAHRRQLGVPLSVFEEIGWSPLVELAPREEGGTLAGC